MGKFTRAYNEYSFDSIAEFVIDVVEEYESGSNIDIIVSCNELPDLLVAFLGTNKFVPYFVEYGIPEMDGYNREYLLSLSHLDDDAIFVEKEWRENTGYILGVSETSDVLFMSQDISKTLFDKRLEEGYNVVLFDIE